MGYESLNIRKLKESYLKLNNIKPEVLEQLIIESRYDIHIKNS